MTKIRDTILSIRGCVGLYLRDERQGTIAWDQTFTNQGVHVGSITLGAPSVTYGDPISSVKSVDNTTYTTAKSTGALVSNLANASLIAAVKTIPGRSIGGAGPSIYCERAGAGNDIWKLAQGISGESNMCFTHRDDAGTLNQPTSGTAINEGKPHVVGVTKAGTGIIFYRDGAADGSSTLTGNDTYTNAGLEARIGEDKADAAAYWRDWIGFVALFNRTLTGGEMRHVAMIALGS